MRRPTYDHEQQKLPLSAQIQLGRLDAREHATGLGHALGSWRSAGTVADDEAICEDCGRSVFLTFGRSVVRPLAGVRRFGSALVIPCSGPRRGRV